MKRRTPLLAALGAVVVVVGLHAGCQSGIPVTFKPAIVVDKTPPVSSVEQDQPRGKSTKASKQAPPDAPFPVPVVELRGPGADLGSQHGQRLADAIRLLHEQYLKRFIEGEVRRFLALSAAQGFASLLTPEYRAEVEGLAKGAGLASNEVMLAQCFLDLSAMTACSTVTLPPEASPDGVARFGRNLDFPALDVADRYSTLFLVHPDGRYAFASVGWPGLIGVLTGMNEHGLTVANMEVTRSPRLPKAMPYTLLYRKVLEECRTTDEAVALLGRTPRQTSNNLMIMDAAGNRAVAEISPEGVTVRRGLASKALVSTNHRRDQDQDAAGKCERYDALHDGAAAHFGRIDPARLERMLADASQADFTLQSMVFEPSNRVLYLSAGANAARGTFHRIDLAPYFAKGR